MRLGLTYDLRADYPAGGVTNDEAAEWEHEDTVAALAATLAALGHDVERIGHVRRLAERLVAGDRWDMVFNMAEGLRGHGRESQVPALLDAYDIPYTFSDAVTQGLTLDKALAKRVVRDSGVPTPDFALVESIEDARAVDLALPLFAKPVAEGSSKGITGRSIVRTRDALVAVCESLLAAYRQPVLVETFLPGREFTVGIVGTGRDAAALGVMEIALTARAEPGVYSRQNKVDYQDRVVYSLLTAPPADEAVAVALAAWRSLGCRDGGRVDVRADANGRVHFLEINTLPGLDPVTGDLVVLCRLLGMPYRDLIGAIVERACTRVAAERELASTSSRSL
jgi:D-alanine-D-alanine ligase